MRRRILAFAAMAALFVAGCSDDVTRTLSPQHSMFPGTITIVRGDGQLGIPGQPVRINPRFIVRDGAGAPAANVRGTITVTSGGGSVSKGTFRTGVSGEITFGWTLGTSGAQQVVAAVTGGSPSVTFNASVIPVGSNLVVTLGNNQTGVPNDTLTTDIRVRLVDPSGNAIPGIAGTRIDWYAIGGGGLRSSTGTLNSDGRASNRWALGWDAQVQQVVAKVTDVDSVIFTANANVAGLSLSILSGNNQTGEASTLLAAPIVVRVTNGAGAFVQGARGTFAVTSGGGSLSRTTFATNINGRGTADWTLGASGTQQVTATIGAIGSVVFNATFPVACPTIAVGGTYVSTTSSFCLSGNAEYTIIPVNTGNAPVAFSFSATNITSTIASPTPKRSSMLSTLSDAVRAPVRNDAWEHQFRKQAAAATARVAASPAFRATRSASMNTVMAVPSVGDVLNLNVSLTGCSNAVMRPSTVKAVGTSIIIVADNSNPAGMSDADYQQIAATYDALVAGTLTTNFGAVPTDLDGNGRVIALYTNAVNALSPPGSGSYVGGFFYSRDLLPAANCATSNVGEMFYMLAADPTGAFGNMWSADHIKSVTAGTLVHEGQHLLNAADRIYGGYPVFPGYEEVWLDEGLSHIAEELLYYAASGFAPFSNIGVSQIAANQAQIDAFFSYAVDNFGRYRAWLMNPSAGGFVAFNDALATRGAAWAMLRYAADRRGGGQTALWQALSGGPYSGLTNLSLRLGIADPKPWAVDFAVAAYADDFTGASAAHSHPSWKFRDLFGAISFDGGATSGYPLATRNPAAGATDAFGLNAGGSAYFPVRVPFGQTATVTTTAPGTDTHVVVFRRN